MGIRYSQQWKIAAVAAFLIGGPAAAAGADPISVTGGALTLTNSNTASIILHAPNIYVSGNLSNAAGDSYLPPNGCFEPSCGAALTLSITDSVSEANQQVGGVVIAGRLEYLLESFSYAIHAGHVAPPPSTLSTVVVTPFTFAGTLTGVHHGDTLTLDLIGHGTARALYLGNEGWIRTEYSFSAAPASTPEPASWLLLATGAAGLIANRRRYPRLRRRLCWNP